MIRQELTLLPDDQGTVRMPSQPHIHQKLDSVACGVLSISDTRTPETDTSGSIVRDLLVGDGHTSREAKRS